MEGVGRIGVNWLDKSGAAGSIEEGRNVVAADDQLVAFTIR